MRGALYDRIVDEIQRTGPMPFDRYMELALYEREGFFGSGHGGPGADADFITSPELSPSFGAALGRWALATGVPRGTPLVEVGAGSGALLSAALGEWQGHGPVHALERSEPARAAIGRALPDVHIGSGLDDLPSVGEVVVIGNEVLDNMPAALARRTEGGWEEIVVALSPGGLTLESGGVRGDVAAWCDAAFGEREPGVVVAAQVAMTDWLVSLLGRFEAVHACLIDYAAPSDELATRPAGSVVRAFRRHRATDVVIDDPGATDLTVEVNIDAIAQAASRLGYGVTVDTQRDLLLELGVADRHRGLIGAEHEAARAGRTMDQLRARSERLDLEALIDPSGLGGFTVFRIGPGTAASPVLP